MEREEYWDRRILSWEAARYSGLAAFNPFSFPVQARLELALSLLRETLPETRLLLDLGCGTGRLAKRLEDFPGPRYLGLDLSEVAVAAARRRFPPGEQRFLFQAVDVCSGEKVLEADTVVMLGLSDWLEPLELQAVLERVRSRRLILSYSAPMNPLFRRAYLAYRRLRFGQGPAYEPRSYSDEEISSLLRRKFKIVESVRDWRLGFGRLVYARSA
jgi:SAM-dependent methyltransferase